MHYILHADLMGSLTVLLSEWRDKVANLGVQLTITACTVLAGDTAHWKYNATGPQVCSTVFSNGGSFSPVVLGNHHGILPYLLLLHDL